MRAYLLVPGPLQPGAVSPQDEAALSVVGGPVQLDQQGLLLQVQSAFWGSRGLGARLGGGLGVGVRVRVRG